MNEGRRVEGLLAEGRTDEAAEALRGVAAHPVDADAYLGLLALWTLERLRGPGHVTAGLTSWTLPPREHPDYGRCLALAAALRATEALRRGDGRTLLSHALEAAEIAPSDSPWLAFVGAAVLQSAYRMTGDAEAARRTLELCGTVGDRTDLPRLAIQARALAGNLHMLRGRFHRADDLLVSALELARVAGLRGETEEAMSLQFRGYLRVEWNRLDEARHLLLRATALGERSGSRGVLSGSYRMLMEVELAVGDREAAARWLGRLEGLMDGPLSDRNREWLSAVRARFQVATGDVRGAAEVVRARGWDAARLAEAESSVLLGRLTEMATLLDILGSLERWDGLAVLAGRLGTVASEANRLWFAARAGAWEAAALEAGGETGRADRVLAGLLPLVEEEGYVRARADLGTPLLPVVERVARDRPSSPVLSRVLAATRLQAAGGPPRPSLTPRETDILGLLARGGSTRAIASELGISPATVKTHLHHLYQKLDVGSRTEALARAAALALL